MKIYGIAITLAAVVASGCGASKKLDAANAEIQNLNQRMARQNDSLSSIIAEDRQSIGQLKEENRQYSAEAADCRMAKEAIQKNLQAMNMRLAEQGTSLEKMADKAEGALDKLEGLGAQVFFDRGRVHIIFPDQYLFKSGSAAVGARGKEALQVMADILNEYPNLETVVVGNTDNVPLKSAAYKDNWALSTERANAVVRVLVNDYRVNPRRMVAAGRAEFNPVSDNSLSDGRAMNRRIEFVLTPDLSRLWEVPRDAATN